MKKGDTVKRNHPYDGTKMAGKPEGPTLRVLEVRGHKPCDGAVEKDCVVILSDGTWSFEWNLSSVL